MNTRSIPFEILEYTVSIRCSPQNSVCEATVKVKVGEVVKHKVAEGNGPVNALDLALRSALIEFFPKLSELQFTDYKVRILGSSAGTAARTSVHVEFIFRGFKGAADEIHENIVEASLGALKQSFARALSQEG